MSQINASPPRMATFTEWMPQPMRPGVVSVLVPAFNREHYIASSLDSIRKQAYRPIEIVVVDDGSVDGTVSEIQRWKDLYSEAQLEVVLVQQSNQGADAARNAALQASSGEYLQFLDSDDLLHYRKFSECLGEFNEPDVDTVVAQFEEFREPQEVETKLSRSPVRQPYRLDGERRPFYTRMGWELWVPVFRRSLLQAAGPMREGIRAGGTFGYTTLLKLHSQRRAYVPLVLNYYRRGVDNALTGIGNSERLPATADVMQWIHESLLQFNISDRAEWKDFTLKCFAAYRKSVVVQVPQGRRRLYDLAGSGSKRWNSLTNLYFSLPEGLVRRILKALVSFKRLARRGT